jgi:hypothetical protein
MAGESMDSQTEGSGLGCGTGLDWVRIVAGFSGSGFSGVTGAGLGSHFVEIGFGAAHAVLGGGAGAVDGVPGGE